MRKYTNQNGLPLSLAVWLATDHYDHNDDPKTFSATTLLKPTRQLVLGARVPQTLTMVDVFDQLENRSGTAVHNGIRDAWIDNYRIALLELGYTAKQVANIRVNPTPTDLKNNPAIQPVYVEQRLFRKITIDEIEYTISGEPDFIAGEAVEDHKNTKTYAYEMDTKKEDFAWQGSIYRWLAPDKIKKDYINLNWLFKDWKPWFVKNGSGYPKSQVLPERYTLKSLPETENFIHRKVQEIVRFWDAPEEEIPHCNDKELWRQPYTWKYYKNPDKANEAGAKSTANFPGDESGAYMRLMKDGSKGAIKKTGGDVKACNYCPAFMACTQKDTYIADGSLVLKS